MALHSHNQGYGTDDQKSNFLLQRMCGCHSRVASVSANITSWKYDDEVRTTLHVPDGPLEKSPPDLTRRAW